MERVPIAMVELCREDGTISPMYVVKDGKYYRVQRVISVTRHAPSVACVSPMRYDCVIDGKRKTVYRDAYPSEKWFSVRDHARNADG